MFRRLYYAMYAKLRAYLVGGTAAAGISGVILWTVAEATGSAPSQIVVGLVTSGSGLLVGAIVSYMKAETHPVGLEQRRGF